MVVGVGGGATFTYIHRHRRATNRVHRRHPFSILFCCSIIYHPSAFRKATGKRLHEYFDSRHEHGPEAPPMSLTPDESSAAPARESAGDRMEGEEQEEVEFGEYVMSNTLDDAVVADTGEAGSAGHRMLEYLQEAREEEEGEDAMGLPANGSAFKKFKIMEGAHETVGRSPTNRSPSSVESCSTPDDTPSLHVRMWWRTTIRLTDGCYRALLPLPLLSGEDLVSRRRRH